MPRQVVGRVQPGRALAYDAAKAYGRMERVSLAGSVWECVAACQAGEGPEQAPDKWIVISAGVTAAEVRGMAARAEAAITAADAASARAAAANAAAEDAAAAARSAGAKAEDAGAKAEEAGTKAEEAGAKADAAQATAAGAQDKADAAREKADKAVADAAAAQATADDKLSRDGDEMTGTLFLKNNVYALGDKISSATNIGLKDKNGDLFAYMGVNTDASGNVHAFLRADNLVSGEKKNGIIGVRVTPDGSIYGYAPVANNFPASPNETIITKLHAQNNYLAKLSAVKNVHVGGSNASDTADLFAGRGNSDKPFASLLAAAEWAALHCAGKPGVNILLHEDAVFGGSLPASTSMSRIQIQSAPGKRVKITASDNITIAFGIYIFGDIDFDLGQHSLYCAGETQHAFLWARDCSFTGANYSLIATGPGASLYMSGATSFGGAASVVVSANSRSTVKLAGTLAGSVTGKRYQATNGGCILTGGKGPNAIPGSVAGTCDENSIYA